ncbi:MAG: M12 family metallo-peptidase [Anaerolineae bacterium]
MLKSFNIWSRETLFAVLLFILLAFSLWQQLPVSGSSNVIFEPIPAPPQAKAESAEPEVMREAYLKFNPAALNGRSAADLSLTLFAEDADKTQIQIEGVHSRTDTYKSGTVWVGRDASDPFSEVILSWQGDVVFGHIRLSNALYRILPDRSAEGVHVVQQLTGIFPPGAEPLVPAGLESADLFEAAELPVSRSPQANQIDILVVYSPSARSQAGGTNNIQNIIYSAVSQTNSSYQNSDVNASLNLVHVQEVDFNESGDINDDLPNLANNQQIQDLREEYGADLVSFMRKDAGNYCGIAYVMSRPSSSFASNAYSVVAYDCAVSNLSFAHETGHNMGAQHDRANAGSSEGAYSYSYGHRYLGSNSFRTIMAYANGCPGFCQRISHWSNNNKFYNGQPTGINHQFSNGAANYLTLSYTAPLVSSFRSSADPTPTPTNTPSPTPTNTPTPTPTPTNTPTPTPTFTPTPLPTIVATIEAGQDSRLSSGDFRFDFPSGTFTDTVEITILALDPDDLPAEAEDGMDTTHYQYVIEAVNLVDRSPVNIIPEKDFSVTVFYDDNGIRRVKEKTLGIFYWDTEATRWVLAANQDFVENVRIASDGSTLTYFAVMGEETEKFYLPITLKIGN